MKTRPARVGSGRQSEQRQTGARRLLVAVDFSDGSKAALRYAAQLAEPFNAAVTVLSVVELNDGWLKIGANKFPVLDDQLRESTQLRLADFARKNGGATSWQCVARLGKPAEEIVRGAEDLGVDAVVIATRGLTGLNHTVMGSTAERVVRSAPCPVWVVPAKGVR
jgi:universal stress protein A